MKVGLVTAKNDLTALLRETARSTGHEVTCVADIEGAMSEGAGLVFVEWCEGCLLYTSRAHET